MRKPLPLSVCMISGAEAPRIGRALASVREWSAEIIVVLNEQVEDGTERIAVEYGAKVFREPWKGYIAQKNSCAEKATQPWLLNLDADEVVSPELAAEIEAILTQSDSASAGFEFPRCTFYAGRWIRHGDWYPDRVLRLWRRGLARWAGEEPHARLEVAGRVGRLQSDLLHFSNDNIAQQIAKIAPYHAELVKRRVSEGVTPGLIEMLFRPGWRFVRAFVFRRGFLDGWQGFYIAALGSFSTLTRYALMLEAKGRQQDG